jgi:hypothetical protein
LPEETLVALLTKAAEESTSLRDFLGHLEAAFDVLLGVHRYMFTAALVPDVAGEMQIAFSGDLGFELAGQYWHGHAGSLPGVAKSWAVGITVHLREDQSSL